MLLGYIRKKYDVPASTNTIALGGSYGGMLSAWFRVKYPQLIAGSIAASAPVQAYQGFVDPNTFSQIITKDFENANSVSVLQIRASWGIISNLWNDGGESGKDTVREALHLCSDAKYGVLDIYNWISTAYSYMAMADYPYPATFLGPMPAYPVTVAAKYFNDTNDSDMDILNAVRQAVNVYYNWTGLVEKCFPIDSSGPSTLGDMGGWNYQSCTEQVLPIGQDGRSDFFWPAPWNLTTVIEGCEKSYGILPRPQWIPTTMGTTFDEVTNIVFSNGNLDPWLVYVCMRLPTAI